MSAPAARMAVSAGRGAALHSPRAAPVAALRRAQPSLPPSPPPSLPSSLSQSPSPSFSPSSAQETRALVPGGRGKSLPRADFRSSEVPPPSLPSTPRAASPAAPPARRRTTGARSPFAAEVLKQSTRRARRGTAEFRKTREDSDAEPYFSRRSYGGRNAAARPPAVARKRSLAEWYESPERAQAAAQLATFDAVTPPTDAQAARPFGWGDLDSCVAQLPHEHWATAFVQQAVRAVDANPSADGEKKVLIVNELLQSLSKLSTTQEDGKPSAGAAP